jgi:YVTN family beta-propeller protein
MRHSWLLLIAGLGWACGDSSAPGFILDVNPDSVVMFRNTVSQLTARLLDAEGHPEPGFAISFESADTAIVKVGQTGLVQSRSTVGRTTIHISGGGATLNVPVQVRGVPSGILMSPTDTLIRDGVSLQYRAAVIDEIGDTMPDALVSWQSSDTTIATVSGTGLATTKTTAGTTMISAKAGALVGPSILRVGIPGVPTEVTVTPADTTIQLGTSLQLTASSRDAFGDLVSSLSVVWASESSSVATVSAGGLVHSEGPTGTAVIRATNGAASGIATVTALDSAFLARKLVFGIHRAAAISVNNVAYMSSDTTFASPGTIVRADLPSRTFGQGVPVGIGPTAIAFNSLGTRAYVTNQFSTSVSVIDVTAQATIDLIPVGFRPIAVLVAPGDSMLWVGRESSVDVIRLVSKQLVTGFVVGGTGYGTVIAQDTLLYVSMYNAHTVIEFNLRTTTQGRIFTVGGLPQALAVSPDGQELYIENRDGYVQFWDLVTGAQIDSLPLSTEPQALSGMARRPSNGLLYVTSTRRLYVIDPVTRSLVYSALIGGIAGDVAFNSDGSIGIIPNQWGWVDFIK